MNLHICLRKLYVIHDQNGVVYEEGNENSTSIKFEKKFIKSSLSIIQMHIFLKQEI